MLRDMDLIRRILMETEKNPCPRGWVNLDIEGHAKEEVAYHVKLLCEAGLVEADEVSTCGPGGFDWKPVSLTWQGHEFLDAARNETTWRRALQAIKERGAGISFELLKFALMQALKQGLGAPDVSS